MVIACTRFWFGHAIFPSWSLHIKDGQIKRCKHLLTLVYTRARVTYNWFLIMRLSPEAPDGLISPWGGASRRVKGTFTYDVRTEGIGLNANRLHEYDSGMG